MFEGKVECPRCGRVWTLPRASPGTYCDCHLTCPDGNLPRDCSVSEQNYSGPLNWPVGLKQDQKDEGEDVLRRTYYCSTHGKYYYKEQIFLEVDWEKWFSRRAPEKFRETKW